MTAWYETSFGSEYLELYAHRDFAEACANISATLGLISPPKDQPLLDLCCGGGRCLLALRNAGFQRLVGLDLSADLLAAAARSLTEAGVPEVVKVTTAEADRVEPNPDRVVLVRADMRDIPYTDYFATVLSFFTSFGYFESDADNRAALGAVFRALRPGGVFLMDYLNREHVIAHLIPHDGSEFEGGRIENRRRITPDGARVEKTVTVRHDDGREQQFLESVRMYTEAEMRWMLGAEGFTGIRSYGSLSGVQYSPDSPRLILVAEKAPEC